MNVPLAWLTALLEWGSVSPNDLLCPTLWLYGTENQNCVGSLETYSAELVNSKVQVDVLDGLNHQQEFSEIDQVIPHVSNFLLG